MRPPSFQLFVMLFPPNHWAEFIKSCYITSPHGWDTREQYYFSVCLSGCPSSVHLSVTLSPPKPLGRIQPNAASLPLMVRVCEATFFPCVRRPSICLSRYLLLNHLAEFNQTCYITSPHGKGVREQHYFSMHLSSIHLSVTLSPPKPLGRIQSN